MEKQIEDLNKLTAIGSFLEKRVQDKFPITDLKGGVHLIVTNGLGNDLSWRDKIQVNPYNIIFGENSLLKKNFFNDLIHSDQSLKDSLELIDYFTTTINPQTEISKKCHVIVEFSKYKNSTISNIKLSLFGFDDFSFTQNQYEDLYQPILFETHKKHQLWDHSKQRYKNLMNKLLNSNERQIIVNTIKAILELEKLHAKNNKDGSRGFHILNTDCLDTFEQLLGLLPQTIKLEIIDTSNSKQEFNHKITRLLSEIYHSILNYLIDVLNRKLNNSLIDKVGGGGKGTIITVRCMDYNPFIVKDDQTKLNIGVMGKMFIHEVVMTALIQKLRLEKHSIANVNASNLEVFASLLACEHNPMSLSTFKSQNNKTTTIQDDMYTLKVQHSFGTYNLVQYDFFDWLVYDSNNQHKSIIHQLQVPILTQFYSNRWEYLKNDFKQIDLFTKNNSMYSLMVNINKDGIMEQEKSYLYSQLKSIGIDAALDRIATKEFGKQYNGRDDMSSTTSLPSTTLSRTSTTNIIIDSIDDLSSPPTYYEATNTNPSDYNNNNEINDTIINIEPTLLTNSKTINKINSNNTIKSNISTPKLTNTIIYDQFLQNKYTKDDPQFINFVSTIYHHENDPYKPLSNEIVNSFTIKMMNLFKSDKYEYEYDLLELLYSYHIALCTNEKMIQFDDDRCDRMREMVQSGIINEFIKFTSQYTMLEDADGYGQDYTSVIGSMTHIIYLAIENMSQFPTKFYKQLPRMLSDVHSLMSRRVTSYDSFVSLGASIVYLSHPNLSKDIRDSTLGRKLIQTLVDCLEPLDQRKSRQIILILFIMSRIDKLFGMTLSSMADSHRAHLIPPFRRLCKNKKHNHLNNILKVNEIWNEMDWINQQNNQEKEKEKEKDINNNGIDINIDFDQDEEYGYDQDDQDDIYYDDDDNVYYDNNIDGYELDSYVQYEDNDQEEDQDNILYDDDDYSTYQPCFAT